MAFVHWHFIHLLLLLVMHANSMRVKSELASPSYIGIPLFKMADRKKQPKVYHICRSISHTHQISPSLKNIYIIVGEYVALKVMY